MLCTIFFTTFQIYEICKKIKQYILPKSIFVYKQKLNKNKHYYKSKHSVKFVGIFTCKMFNLYIFFYKYINKNYISIKNINLYIILVVMVKTKYAITRKQP